MIDFISVWRRQIILVITAPQRAKDDKNGRMEELRRGKIKDTRRKPYLPSFRRSPAKIIEPATGAST
jgi:hypothetical protein